MLRVRPQPGFRLKGSVMGDLSMVRYEGYSALPEAAALRAELEREEGESLAHGIHLIAVQSADGRDRKSTRLNSSHLVISYAVFCLKKKKNIICSRLLTTRYLIRL